MDQLIVKYLQNKLTLQEQHQLSKWLAEDDDHQELLRKMEAYWKDHASNLDEKESKVKARLIKRIVEDSLDNKTTHVTMQKDRSWAQLIRYAAVFILGLGAILAVYNLDISNDDSLVVNQETIIMEKMSAPGEKLTIKLPDGSTVKLNSGSTIIYPSAFDQESREVELRGEGFFEVTKDPNRPFIVIANKARVKVLGTSFNVNTDGSESKVIVGVKTGQVKVSNHQETISRILEPNDMVVYNDADQLMNIQQINDPELVFGWTDQLLVFNDDHLDRVLNILSNWFGVEFILSQNIDNQRVFTSRFKNPTLSSVMESLSYVYDFKYEINEKTIIIK